MKQVLFLIITAVIFSSCTATKPEPKGTKISKIYSEKQQKELNLKELAKEALAYRVIFVGDEHKSKATHQFFDEFLKTIATDKKIVLGVEWFNSSHQTILDDFLASKISANELALKRNWAKTIGYDFNQSLKHYEIIKSNSGRIVGLNISKDSRNKISLNKTGEMNENELEFYKSLELNTSKHKALVMPFLKHCEKYTKKTPEPCYERMYRVQTAWDSFMAKRALETLQGLKKDEILVVFIGNMHAIKLGAPLRFARLSNEPFYVIGMKNSSLDSSLADAWFVKN